MAKGYVEAKYENIPGNETNTPTLSTKDIFFPLIDFQPQLNPSPMDRDDELRNQDEPLALLEEAHDPAWSYESRAYPDLLAWYLKLGLGNPVSTAGNGVITDPDTVTIPTGATRHVWTAPFGPTGVNPLTAQVQAAYQDEATFFKLKGAALAQFGLDSPPQGGARVKASGPALFLQRIADPALTPAFESLTINPFKRANLTLPTWLTGSGTHEDFSLGFVNPVTMVRSLGIASKFPDVMEKDDGLIVFSGSLAQREIDQDDFDALKAATGFAATARWVSDSIIASGYAYKLYVVMSNVQYTGGGPDPLSNKRRIGGNFNFKATYAGSASVTVTLVNATASYA